VALYAWRKPDLRLALDYGTGELAGALALVIGSSLPVLVMGARMAAGDFPAEFFAADTPHFLSHVYALATTASYPPPSLETYGLAFKYHYGFQAFAALLSLLTQLQPHVVMFAVAVPLMEILAGLLLYDICRRLTGRPGAALLCLLLVLLGSKQYLVNYLDPSAWDFVTRAENFDFRYAHPPSLAGLLVSLCSVRCILEFERRDRRFAALFFLVMLPLFKTPYLVPVGAGLALVYFLELRRRFRPELLAEIAGAALLSLLCLTVFAGNAAGIRAEAGFAVPGFLRMSMDWQNQTLAILCALVAATAAATRMPLSEGLRRLLMFAVSPYLLFSMFRFENGNEYQIFDLALKLAALFASVYFVSAWLDRAGRRVPRHAIAVAVLVGLTGPGAISLFHHLYIVAVHPERGHEYVDNRALADALRHIPLNGSLIATNDVRYPANHYLRNYRQFQLAALYGHRNLAADLWYGDMSQPDRIRYAAWTRLFQEPSWPAAQIDRLRQRIPITHVLIHKSYAHASDIPLALVYENGDYAVYR
jgi:hypothetical protein